jgi:16S rRNA (guanine527-N7)-methyltransferase
MMNPAPQRATRSQVPPEDELVRDALRLGVSLTPADATGLLQLITELGLWNQRYNLTAIRQRAAMISHHLLDSLSVHPDLQGERVADVGTGAGFPGLPLALCNPARRFTLIDSTAKKIRFVAHAVEVLALANVQAVHARAEQLSLPAFDTVVARALAPLPELLGYVQPLCGAHTRVLAMKGRWPQAELAALPRGWRMSGARELHVPHIDAARCVIILQRDII